MIRMVNVCEELRNRKKRKLHIVEILHKLKKLLNEINDDDSPNVTSMAFTINQLSLKSTLLKLKESTYKMLLKMLASLKSLAVNKPQTTREYRLCGAVPQVV